MTIRNSKVVIDESLILWKGHLNFKKYIPSKRHRFGVKLFVPCDYRSGFFMDVIIYADQQTEVQLDKELGMSTTIVMTLMNSYMDKGHGFFYR